MAKDLSSICLKLVLSWRISRSNTKQISVKVFYAQRTAMCLSKKAVFNLPGFSAEKDFNSLAWFPVLLFLFFPYYFGLSRKEEFPLNYNFCF
jgi:hypothetical protein